MNIARAGTVRLDQQHGYEPDNRRICFIKRRRFRAIAKLQTEIDVFSNFFLNDVRCFVGRSVVFDQRFANFPGARANQFQLALQEKTQAVHRVDVERVAHCDHQPGLAESDRDHFEAARIFSPDLVNDLRRNDHGRDVDPIHLRLRSERARDVHLGHRAVVDQDIDHARLAV